MGKDKTNGPIYCDEASLRGFVHGRRKSEVLQTAADGHLNGSFLNVPTGMSETNPFKSEKQRKFLYSQKPEVAKKFAAHGKMK